MAMGFASSVFGLMTPSECRCFQKRFMKTPSLLQRCRRASHLHVGAFITNRIRQTAGSMRILARAAVKALDRLLRGFMEIHEFTQDQRCILRVARTYSKSSVILPNGESIMKGDRILELHFWNERLAFVHPILRSSLRTSLALVGEQLRTNERFQDIRAIHGTLVRPAKRLAHVHSVFGCSTRVVHRFTPNSLHDLLEDFLIYFLRWTFNPRNMTLRARRLSRTEIWISVSDVKEKLCEKTGRFNAISGFRNEEHYERNKTVSMEVMGD